MQHSQRVKSLDLPPLPIHSLRAMPIPFSTHSTATSLEPDCDDHSALDSLFGHALQSLKTMSIPLSTHSTVMSPEPDCDDHSSLGSFFSHALQSLRAIHIPLSTHCHVSSLQAMIILLNSLHYCVL